jgi:hypothetical protein
MKKGFGRVITLSLNWFLASRLSPQSTASGQRMPRYLAILATGITRYSGLDGFLVRRSLRSAVGTGSDSSNPPRPCSRFPMVPAKLLPLSCGHPRNPQPRTRTRMRRRPWRKPAFAKNLHLTNDFIICFVIRLIPFLTIKHCLQPIAGLTVRCCRKMPIVS